MHTFVTSRILRLGPLSKIPSLLASMLVFGLVPFLAIFIFATWERRLDILFRIQTLPTLVAIAWLSFGPALIRYFDESFIPGFWSRLRSAVEGEGALVDAFQEQFSRDLHEKYHYFGAPLAAGIIIMRLTNSDYACRYWAACSLMDPLTIAIIASIALVVYLSGIGFCGVFQLIRSLHTFREFRLRLDPYSSDKCGGMNFLGNSFVGGTLAFSSGLLLIPPGIQVMTFSQTYHADVGYLLLVVYLFFLTISFFGPLLVAKRMISRDKNALLRAKLKEQTNLIGMLETSTAASDTMSMASRILVLREDIRDINRIREWPVSNVILAKFATAVFPTILLGLIKAYLAQYGINL